LPPLLFDLLKMVESNENNLNPLLLPAREAAKLLNISLAFFYSLHNTGKVPLPRKLGRRTLWSVQELKDWIAAACPGRAEWQRQRKKD